MARIRTVKPALFRHEALFEAEEETGLPLRLAFIGMFTCCDREGRFEWRPRQLKLDVMPYDNIDFSRVLDALFTRGFLVKYEVEGKFYGCIPSFINHQVINNRESASVIPEPRETRAYDDTDTSNSEFIKPEEQFDTEVSRVNHASITRHELAQGEGEGEGEGERNKQQLQQRAKVFESEPVQEFKSAKEFSDHWQPEQATVQRILMLSIPEEFIRKCIPEFVGFWLTANKLPFGGNYETAFFKSTQRAWVAHQNQRGANHANPNQRSTQTSSAELHRLLTSSDESDWSTPRSPFDAADSNGSGCGGVGHGGGGGDFPEMAGAVQHARTNQSGAQRLVANLGGNGRDE